MTRHIPFLTLALLATAAPVAAREVDVLRPEPLATVLARRHAQRWGELSHLLEVGWPADAVTGTVITLNDDHLGPNDTIKPEVLGVLSRRKNLAGIILRNTSVKSLAGIDRFKDKLKLLDLYGTPTDDVSLETISRLTQLRELDLGVTRVTAAGLATLKPLKLLHILDLSGRRMTDRAVTAIKPLQALRHLSLAGSRITDVGVSELSDTGKLRALALTGTRIEGGTLDSLGKLPDLALLDLADTDITGDSLARLSRCRRLQALNLENCPLVIDASTAHLARLKTLRGLVLRKTGFETESITGAGLSRIATLSKLEHLNLSATRIQDASLVPLTQLKRLRRLNLGLTGLSNAGLVHLAKLPSLERLAVMYQEGFGGTKVTAEGLVHLANHKTLRHLDLTGTKISDADLPRFKPLAQLTRLTISGTGITLAGAARLARQLPDCQVIR